MLNLIFGLSRLFQIPGILINTYAYVNVFSDTFGSESSLEPGRLFSFSGSGIDVDFRCCKSASVAVVSAASLIRNFYGIYGYAYDGFFLIHILILTSFSEMSAAWISDHHI